MPAGKKLPPPGSGVATRASNKFKHPGNALKNQPVLTQKTHEDEENERQEEAEKHTEIQSVRKAAVAVIASLEDDLVSQDMQREQARIEGYKSSKSLICSLCLISDHENIEMALINQPRPLLRMWVKLRVLRR